jgi:hypothetical protein
MCFVTPHTSRWAEHINKSIDEVLLITDDSISYKWKIAEQMFSNKGEHS